MKKAFKGKDNINAKPDSLFRYLLIAAIVLAACMFLLNSQKKPERFSLFSLVPGSYPSEVEAGIKFNFGMEIYNHEGKPVLYEYRILVDGEETAEGRAVLNDGERRQIFEPVVLNEKGAHKVQALMIGEGKEYSVFFKVEIV